MSDIIGLKVGDIRGKSKPIIVEHKQVSENRFYR